MRLVKGGRINLAIDAPEKGDKKVGEILRAEWVWFWAPPVLIFSDLAEQRDEGIVLVPPVVPEYPCHIRSAANLS